MKENTMALTPIDQKIAMLLAKAESTDSVSEAEALTEAAEKLMIRHGIEMAQVDAARGDKPRTEEIITARIIWVGSHSKTWLHFTSTLAGATGTVKGMYSEDRDRETGKERIVFTVYGFETDVAQFVALADSLRLQAITAEKVWWKGYDKDRKSWMNNSQKWRERRGFTWAFAAGAGSRLMKTRETVVAETGPGTEVMLASRLDEVEKFMPQGRASRTRMTGGSMTAHAAGIQAGKSANTNNTAVGGRAAIGS